MPYINNPFIRNYRDLHSSINCFFFSSHAIRLDPDSPDSRSSTTRFAISPPSQIKYYTSDCTFCAILREIQIFVSYSPCPFSFPNAFSTRACPDFTKTVPSQQFSLDERKRKVSFPASSGWPVPCVVLGKVGESRRKAHHSCLALFSSWMEKQGEGNSMPCRPECGPLFSEARRG